MENVYKKKRKNENFSSNISNYSQSHCTSNINSCDQECVETNFVNFEGGVPAKRSTDTFVDCHIFGGKEITMRKKKGRKGNISACAIDSRNKNTTEGNNTSYPVVEINCVSPFNPLKHKKRKVSYSIGEDSSENLLDKQNAIEKNYGVSYNTSRETNNFNSSVNCDSVNNGACSTPIKKGEKISRAKSLFVSRAKRLKKINSSYMPSNTIHSGSSRRKFSIREDEINDNQAESNQICINKSRKKRKNERKERKASQCETENLSEHSFEKHNDERGINFKELKLMLKARQTSEPSLGNNDVDNVTQCLLPIIKEKSVLKYSSKTQNKINVLNTKSCSMYCDSNKKEFSLERDDYLVENNEMFIITKPKISKKNRKRSVTSLIVSENPSEHFSNKLSSDNAIRNSEEGLTTNERHISDESMNSNMGNGVYKRTKACSPILKKKKLRLNSPEKRKTNIHNSHPGYIDISSSSQDSTEVDDADDFQVESNKMSVIKSTKKERKMSVSPSSLSKNSSEHSLEKFTDKIKANSIEEWKLTPRGRKISDVSVNGIVSNELDSNNLPPITNKRKSKLKSGNRKPTKVDQLNMCVDSYPVRKDLSTERGDTNKYNEGSSQITVIKPSKKNEGKNRKSLCKSESLSEQFCNFATEQRITENSNEGGTNLVPDDCCIPFEFSNAEDSEFEFSEEGEICLYLSPDESDCEDKRDPKISLPSFIQTDKHSLSGSDNILTTKDNKMNSTQIISDEEYDKLLSDAISNQHNFSEDVIRNLKKLRITLDDVHPLHCVPLPPCSTPSKKDKMLFVAFNVTEGQFRKSEDDIINANWQKFCQEYEFKSPEPFINTKHKHLTKESRRKFLQYLGCGLPNRPLFKIFNRFAYLCQHKTKGGFSREEDKIIVKTMQRNLKNPFSVLSSILKRNRQSVYKRYQMILNSADIREASFEKCHLIDKKADESSTQLMKREIWSLSLAQALVKPLIKAMKVSSIKELKGLKIPTQAWKQVEKDINVPHWKLRQYWNYKLHVQLFAKSQISENKIFKNIVVWLYDLNPTTLKDIPWKHSLHLFRGSTVWFMWEMFRRLRNRCGAINFKNLKTFIDYLYSHEDHLLLSKDRCITRYYINADNILSEIEEN